MIHITVICFIIYALLVFGLSYSMYLPRMWDDSNVAENPDCLQVCLDPFGYDAQCNEAGIKIVKWCETYRTLYRQIEKEMSGPSGTNAAVGLFAATIGCVIAVFDLVKTMSPIIAVLVTLLVGAIAFFAGKALSADNAYITIAQLQRDYATFRADEECAKRLRDAEIDTERFSPFNYYVVNKRAEYMENVAPLFCFKSRLGTTLGGICFIFGLAVMPAFFY